METNESTQMPDFSKMKKVFRNLEKGEEINMMLQSLARENNVPNDIFEHLKVTSDVHYFLPILFVVGQIQAPYSYEKKKGEKIYHYEDAYICPACFKLPAYAGSDVPKEAWVPLEMFEPKYSATYIPPENLEKQKVGWTLIEPEAGEMGEVLTFWGKDMAKMFKEHTRQDLEKNLGSVDNLKIKDNSFAPGAGPGIDPISSAYEEVAIVEYDYKGTTYRCVCFKNEVKHVSIPQDSESKEIERQANLRKNICWGVMGLFLILHFVLIHSWIVTIIAIAIASAALFKFNHELKQIRNASSGSRLEKLKGINAIDLIEHLKNQ